MTTVRVPEDFPTLAAALASSLVKKGDNILVKRGMSEGPVVVPFNKVGIRVWGYAGKPDADTGEEAAGSATGSETGDDTAQGALAEGNGPAAAGVVPGDRAAGAADGGPQGAEAPGEEGAVADNAAATQQLEETDAPALPQEPGGEKSPSASFTRPRPVATAAGPVTRFIRVGQGPSSLSKLTIRRRF